MALVIADRVQEVSAVVGTVDAVLTGAKTGYRTFGSVLANADTTYYVIESGAEWEVGLGTYTTATNTLGRTTVIASSNANAKVNFSAGTKNVFITAAAAMLPPDPVRSFNGRTGTITPVQADYDAFFTTTAEAAAAAPVQSVNGQTGAVSLALVSVFRGTVNTTANTPATVTHNLTLPNKDEFVIRVADSTGADVGVRVVSVDANSLTITTAIAVTGLIVTVIGL